MTFPVKAVVFDWAGTMIDFGCMAPVRALQSVFAAEGLEITDAQARADMGRAKLDHLRALLANRDVAARWHDAKSVDVAEADIARLYEALQPAMREAAANASALIPGAAQTFAALTALGVRVGSGTGYTRAMMEPILAAAAQQGYAPELVVCAGETPSGRPAPLMTWKALVELDAWPARACIKVDDAPVGIEEGRLAGCWTVGVTASGNGVGLTREALAALAPADRAERLAKAGAELTAAGADFLIEDVSQLAPVVDEIARRIRA
jgi:phosphonoacetaldehyde hydrolase